MGMMVVVVVCFVGVVVPFAVVDVIVAVEVFVVLL